MPLLTEDVRSTLATIVQRLTDKDLTALAEMYTEDGVHELPFAPPGAPKRLAGREQVRAYFTVALASVPLDFDSFTEVAVHPTADPTTVIAEYDASGRSTATGARFTLRYVWVLQIAEGRIALWRDYWNPQEVLALQGEASSQR